MSDPASHDPVSRPAHYTFGSIEVLDAIEEWKLDYHRGNVVKYVVRAGRKEGASEVEDLRKARFYLDRLIARLERPAVVLCDAVYRVRPGLDLECRLPADHEGEDHFARDVFTKTDYRWPRGSER